MSKGFATDNLITKKSKKKPKVDHLLIYVNSSALTVVGKARAASSGSSKRFI